MVYLTARLGLVRLVTGDRRPPLVLDDPFVTLDDDRATLRFLFDVLAPGGVLVLTVPAHMFLFGEMDRLACHRRRYAKGELAQKLLDAGFEVRLLTHFMAPLVPLLLLFRQLGRLIDALGFRSKRRSTQELALLPLFNPVMRGVLCCAGFVGGVTRTSRGASASRMRSPHASKYVTRTGDPGGRSDGS